MGQTSCRGQCALHSTFPQISQMSLIFQILVAELSGDTGLRSNLAEQLLACMTLERILNLLTYKM